MNVVLDFVHHSTATHICELDLTDFGNTVCRGSAWNPGFRGCDNMRKIHWPRGILVIGDYLFIQTGLVVVDLSVTSVRELGRMSFCGRRSLHTLLLLSTLESVGAGCFAESALGDISLRHCRRLGHIGGEAFAYCQKLRELILPVTMQGGGVDIWADCWMLELVDFAPSVRVPLCVGLGSELMRLCGAKCLLVRGGEQRWSVASRAMHAELAYSGTTGVYHADRPVLRLAPFPPMLEAASLHLGNGGICHPIFARLGTAGSLVGA
jgi:hypothetical protein